MRSRGATSVATNRPNSLSMSVIIGRSTCEKEGSPKTSSMPIDLRAATISLTGGVNSSIKQAYRRALPSEGAWLSKNGLLFAECCPVVEASSSVRLLGRTPIDEDRLPGDEARFVRAQEQ